MSGGRNMRMKEEIKLMHTQYHNVALTQGLYCIVDLYFKRSKEKKKNTDFQAPTFKKIEESVALVYSTSDLN